MKLYSLDEKNINFSKYLPKEIQKDFYCSFGGLVNIFDDGHKVGEEGRWTAFRKIYYKNTFVKDISELSVGTIKQLMKLSLKERQDCLFLYSIAFKKG